MSTIVHIVGTGTIGEPLIGLFSDFGARMGVDEVTFHKRTPLLSDRAKLNHLMSRGAKLAVHDDVAKDFKALGHEVSYEADEALARASVVIDCTPAGNDNKEKWYADAVGPRGFLAQGSEFDFGKPYARGINEEVFEADLDRFIQIVSCNTHNIVTLIKTLSGDTEPGRYDLDSATFVCIRRANDISQTDKFVPSPNVGRHDDAEYGTHHARDARHVFKTQGVDLDLFSSAVKVNTQYMHSIWYRIVLKRETTLKEVVEKLRANPLVAMTDKRDANVIFSFGRDHGYYGRILSQTVVVVPTITVRHGREIYGFCFTPQDGNSLLSSIAAALWRIDPNWDSVAERLAPLRRWLYREI
jgi:glyceraldehyde-3-phosphate dehydrogenase/erythrose-4-phosphate dehydrogenase